jgi:hypothetical protein
MWRYAFVVCWITDSWHENSGFIIITDSWHDNSGFIIGEVSIAESIFTITLLEDTFGSNCFGKEQS